MKKCVFVSFVIFFFSFSLSAQTVDSIKVEQSGDVIKIHYKILNSTEYQIFRVKVLCSINGGLLSELKSLSGDFGDNVVGGRSDYMILWDVLKDMEELNSAEFVVRAELVKGNPTVASKVPKVKGPPAHKFHLMPSLQLPGPGYGLRFGYMGKAGFSMNYITTKSKKLLLPDSNYNDSTGAKRLDRLSIDFTARIINKETFQTHLLFGSTIGPWICHYPDDISDRDVHLTGGIDAGLAFYLHRIAFSVTGSRYLTSLSEEKDVIADTKRTFITFGFGVRF
jgi:hypothetical protein